MKKKLMISILLSLMFALFSSPAFASMATATAELDWSNLTYSTNISFGALTTSVTASADNNFEALQSGSDGGADWADYSFSAAVTQASATAAANGSVLSATSTAGEDGVVLPVSSAIATRIATFSVTSTASVWFSIPYSLSYTASATAGLPASISWANASAYYVISLTRFINGDQRVSTEMTGDIVFSGQSSSDSQGENIIVTLTGFQQGDAGEIFFQTGTHTASSVPIPAGLWLLGSGLVGLVGIRRKVTKA